MPVFEWGEGWTTFPTGPVDEKGRPKGLIEVEAGPRRLSLPEESAIELTGRQSRRRSGWIPLAAWSGAWSTMHTVPCSMAATILAWSGDRRGSLRHEV